MPSSLDKLAWLAVSFFLLVSTLTASVQAYTDYKNEFSIDPPAGWTVDSSVSFAAVVFKGPIEGGFMSNINMQVEKLSQDLTLAQYVQNAKLSIAMILPNSTLDSESARTIDGIDAYELEYTVIQENVTVQEKMVIVLANSRAYVITYASSDLYYDDHLSEFDTSVSTFKILPHVEIQEPPASSSTSLPMGSIVLLIAVIVAIVASAAAFWAIRRRKRAMQPAQPPSADYQNAQYAPSSGSQASYAPLAGQPVPGAPPTGQAEASPPPARPPATYAPASGQTAAYAPTAGQPATSAPSGGQPAAYVPPAGPPAYSPPYYGTAAKPPPAYGTGAQPVQATGRPIQGSATASPGMAAGYPGGGAPSSSGELSVSRQPGISHRGPSGAVQGGSLPQASSTKASRTPSGAFAVEDVFLIFMDGRLIQHTTRRIKADMDVDIMTSMLRAVQEFVKDSLGGGGGTELGGMECGDSKILLQKGRYVVIAAVVSGDEPEGFREELRTAVNNIEGEFGGTLVKWDGRAAALAGTGKFLSQLGAFRPVEPAPVRSELNVSLMSELEFYQGFVRLKVAIRNDMAAVIINTAFKLVYEGDSLRLDSIEPELQMEGGEVQLGIIGPREKKTMAFYLDPQICSESYLDGNLTFKDANGNFHSITMPRKRVSVVCPIVYTEENINTAMLKRMAAEELDKKDSKVFAIPPVISPENAFSIGKAAVQHHDVRLVRELTQKNPFISEGWYYGKAKGRNERLIIRVRVLAEKNFLEFFVASSSILMLTGMLAELKSDLNKELDQIRLRGKMTQISEPEKVKSVSSVRTLLEKESEAESAIGETDVRR